MRFSRRTLFIAFALIIVLILIPSNAWSQGGSTSIRGTVTDAQGATVAHAKVAITNLGNNFTRSQESTPTGAYSFELIPVGDYDVIVEAPGFRKAEFKSVHGLVDSVVTIDVKLE